MKNFDALQVVGIDANEQAGRFEIGENRYREVIKKGTLEKLSGKYRYLWAAYKDTSGNQQVAIGWENYRNGVGRMLFPNAPIRTQGHPTLVPQVEVTLGKKVLKQKLNIIIAGEMRYTYVRGTSYCGQKGSWIIDNASGRFGNVANAESKMDAVALLIYDRSKSKTKVLIDLTSSNSIMRTTQEWRKTLWFGSVSTNLSTPKGGY